MGKGGGGPTHTTSEVSQSSLPAYAQPYYERLMSRAEAETNQNYIPYTGQRLQGFSADQLGGFQGIRDLAAFGNPTVDSATGLAGSAGIQALGAGNYTPLYASTGAWPGANVQSYMDPYLDNVMNRLQNRATQRYQEQAAQRAMAAERAKAFGGSRSAIQDFLAQRELNQQLGDIEANQYSQAYQNAQQMYTSDQDRALRAMLANQGVDFQSAQLGLQGAESASQIAQVLGQLGSTQQNLTLDRLRALMDAGQQQQALGQQDLQIGYDDFTNQRDFERNNLAFLSGILQGVPVEPGSEIHRTTPGPSSASQLLGAGIAGTQLANMGGRG